MDSQQIARGIAEDLEDGHVVAFRPDVPNLLVGPDILVGSSGKLTAVFVLKKAELINRDDLLFRLALSRLSLTPNLYSVLVSDQGNILDLETHFDAVFRSDDRRNLKLFIDNGTDARAKRSVSNDVRRWNYERYTTLLTEGYRILEMHREVSNSIRFVRHYVESYGFFESQLNVRGWSKSRRNQIAKVSGGSVFYRYDKFVIGAVNLKSETRSVEKIKSTCRTIFKINYVIDSGIPHLADPTLNILVVDKIPQTHFDPMKLFRAAAFAGLLLLESNDMADLDALFSRAQELVEH